MNIANMCCCWIYGLDLNAAGFNERCLSTWWHRLEFPVNPGVKKNVGGKITIIEYSTFYYFIFIHCAIFLDEPG